MSKLAFYWIIYYLWSQMWKLYSPALQSQRKIKYVDLLQQEPKAKPWNSTIITQFMMKQKCIYTEDTCWWAYIYHNWLPNTDPLQYYIYNNNSTKTWDYKLCWTCQPADHPLPTWLESQLSDCTLYRWTNFHYIEVTCQRPRLNNWLNILNLHNTVIDIRTVRGHSGLPVNI